MGTLSLCSSYSLVKKIISEQGNEKVVCKRGLSMISFLRSSEEMPTGMGSLGRSALACYLQL